LSNDSTLASLTVTPGTLSPEFNSAVAEYMVQVPTGTASFDITATVSDPGAFVTGTGTIELVSADTTVSVVVMAEDGSTMTYNVNVTVAVGVKDQVYNIARVYPNPTSGILNIEGQQVQTIEVYNLSGSKMRVETNGDNQIDVSSLVHGTYILRITNTKNQVSVVKFVKVTGTR
jgi:hypothetical protein